MKGKQKSTGKMPGFHGKSMAASPGPSGKAIATAHGSNMTRLTVKQRRATGSQN